MGGPVADIHGTIGAEFWGVMLATALWGVTCMQTWWYYDNYPNDHRTLKVLVAATWISDTVHEALILHIVYEAGISNFGDVESLDRIPPFLYLEVLFNALTGLFVQLFLTFRIWTLRKNFWLVCVLVVSIVAGFVVSLLYMIFGLHRRLFDTTSINEVKGLSMSINILAAVSDLLITASMCMILNMARTGFSWSDHIINRLILFSMNTGLLTSIVACMSLVTILALPNTLVYAAFYYVSEYGGISDDRKIPYQFGATTDVFLIFFLKSVHPLSVGRCKCQVFPRSRFWNFPRSNGSHNSYSYSVYANSLLATLNARKSIRATEVESRYNTTRQETFELQLRSTSRAQAESGVVVVEPGRGIEGVSDRRVIDDNQEKIGIAY
ncbi:hypothetical protein PM082_024627 [Marasmius tenuissimus]|nr:hypothetical protein PM082_024627 [Marasmius tenuissimus]